MPDLSTDLHVGDYFLLRPAFPLNRTQRQGIEIPRSSLRRRGPFGTLYGGQPWL